jgi:hypothetical protein
MSGTVEQYLEALIERFGATEVARAWAGQVTDRCPGCDRHGTVDRSKLDEFFKAHGRTPAEAGPSSLGAATIPEFGSQRYYVLRALYDMGPSNAAAVAREVARLEYPIAKNQVATRLGECRSVLDISPNNRGGGRAPGKEFVRYVRDEHGGFVYTPTNPLRPDGRQGAVQELTALGGWLVENIRSGTLHAEYEERTHGVWG